MEYLKNEREEKNKRKTEKEKREKENKQKVNSLNERGTTKICNNIQLYTMVPIIVLLLLYPTVSRSGK